MFRSIHAVILALSASTMLGHTVACNASDGKFEVVGQVPVELRDLNLHDPDTARLLLARLDRAAWQACGGDPRFNDSYETRPGHVRRVYRECRDKAVARAVKEIGVQTLTQAYNESKSEPPKEASTRSTAPGPTLSTPGSAWEPGRRAGG